MAEGEVTRRRGSDSPRFLELLLKMRTWHVPRTPQTLEKPWFPVVSRWIALEPVSGAVVAEKSPKAGLYQLVET